MPSLRIVRLLSLTVMAAILAAATLPLPPVSGTSDPQAPTSTNVVTLEDYSDIATQLDTGFNDFGGNMGAINDQYIDQMTLQCPGAPQTCALQLDWDFGEVFEDFTGLFFSLFGLTDTRTTFDGSTIESISFPEHSLNLDRIDAPLTEPQGPRRFDQLCVQLTYDEPQNLLKLRVELKDAGAGVRFTRFLVPGDPDPQTHCWPFRNSYQVPSGEPDLDLHQAKLANLVVERRHIVDGVNNPISGTLTVDHIWFTLDQAESRPPTSQELLDLMERRAYQYFLDWSSRKTGSLDIPQDRSTFGDLLTVGGIGFALPAHLIAADQGWISRTEAAQRVLNVLRTLDPPTAFGPEPVGRIGYKGWFYHFFGIDGRRKLNFDFPETPAVDESLNTVELSSIDTSLALMGILAAQSYFDHPTQPHEVEIRSLAQSIYDRVDWPFMLEPQSGQFYLGWKPNEDREGPSFEIPDGDWLGSFSGTAGHPATLDYYTDEALMAVLLSAGSETHPLPPGAYCALYNVQDQDSLVRTYPGALFTYQFLQAFFDTGDWQLLFGPAPWYENSRTAIARAIAYAEDNPRGYATYGPHAWGLSAAEGPADAYQAYGAPSLALNPAPEEDGTVTYYAMLSAAGFGDDLRARAVDALGAAWDRGHWHPRFALPDAFHAEISQAGVPGTALRTSGAWVNRALFAIDQGPLLLHLANARSGLIHDLIASNPNIQRALDRLASSAPHQVVLPGEAGSGDGSIMMRSNAWGERTVWLHAGESRSWDIDVPAGHSGMVHVRYSNDNAGPLETVSILLDGLPVGHFQAQDTGDHGQGWNQFQLSEPLHLGEFGPGDHTLTVQISGGDTYGVEIDTIVLDYCAQPYCQFLPLTAND